MSIYFIFILPCVRYKATSGHTYIDIPRVRAFGVLITLVLFMHIRTYAISFK